MSLHSIISLRVGFEMFLADNSWFFLERRVEVVLEKIVGMNLSSFEPLFVLHWEIYQFLVANKKLLFFSLSLVIVIRYL